MTDEEFLKLVDAGVDALPAHILARIENVAVVIADDPTPQQRDAEGLADGETLFGLYEGVPLTERGANYGFVLPDKITVFKNPILATYHRPEDITACVANTVWHEVAHHFGFDDPWIYEEEKKRGKDR
jgi:predicted Zn-dependent protease with MMP-like domain